MADTTPAVDAAAKGKGPAPSGGTSSAPPTAESAGILPAGYWAAQAGDDDNDSALGDSESSTASLSSTILQYRTLHGRTYHAERGNAHYWGSNDDRQNETLDIAHHAFYLELDGKLFLAPLEKDNVKKVLDVGTGTGIWAIDFGDDFQHAEVIGTDVSPIQPGWVPPNVRFEIEDCTQTWTFAPDSFDFIHIRYLIGSIENWTALFENAYKACKPGGYVESFEPSAMLQSDDDTIADKSALSQWGKFYVEGGRKLGRTFELYQHDTQRKALEAAGFVDITEKNIKTPLGGWSKDPKLKEIGQFTQLAVTQDPEGLILFLAFTLGWTREEILVYIAQFKRELRSGKSHAWYWQKVIWGRKPEAS